MDRLDYTKGIIERFKAIETMLLKHRSLRRHFVFIQVAPPSRSSIPRYRELEEEVTREAERINEHFRALNWKPIVLLKKRHSHKELYRLYRLCNICVVTSLHDGMNLVAKEFVAARDDERGALVLSQFAGASRELRDALIINPYNIVEVAEAMKKGLEMSKTEQRARMRKMREVVRNNNVYRWSADLLKSLMSLG